MKLCVCYSQFTHPLLHHIDHTETSPLPHAHPHSDPLTPHPAPVQLYMFVTLYNKNIICIAGSDSLATPTFCILFNRSFWLLLQPLNYVIDGFYCSFRKCRLQYWKYSASAVRPCATGSTPAAINSAAKATFSTEETTKTEQTNTRISFYCSQIISTKSENPSTPKCIYAFR